MYRMNCKLCNKPYGDPNDINQARVLPCTHNICGGCINAYMDQNDDVQCPYCFTRFPDDPRSFMVNKHYYEMLKDVNEYLSRVNNQKYVDEDEESGEERVAWEGFDKKCRNVGCFNMAYEKEGEFEPYCSPKCEEIVIKYFNQLGEDFDFMQ